MSSDKKLVLITGANSGIGLEACKILCSEGHSVIATVRSDEKGQATTEAVQRVCHDADISYMLLDTADLNSIKQFIRQLPEKSISQAVMKIQPQLIRLAGRKLDVLVNNAGMSPGQQKRLWKAPNMSNINYCLATNTAGPLIISELLLDHMKQVADERIELMMGVLAFCDELGKDSKVRVNMFCPGAVPDTEIYKNQGSCYRCCCRCICSCCSCVFQKQSLEEGGEHLAALAIRAQGESMGNFYSIGSLREPHPEILDRDNQQTVLKSVRQLINQ